MLRCSLVIVRDAQQSQLHIAQNKGERLVVNCEENYKFDN